MFISYAREDVAAASRLAGELAEAGIAALIDIELAEGDPFWRDAIRARLHDCRLMVCLQSAAALASPWVEQERRAFAGPRVALAAQAGDALATILAAWRAAGGRCGPRVGAVALPTRRQERAHTTARQQGALETFLARLNGQVRPTPQRRDGSLWLADGALELRPVAGSRGRLWLGRTPVTNAIYRRFLAVHGHAPPSVWQHAGFGADTLPVTGITWFEAAACAAWLGASLPDEAVWQQAANGGDARRRYATANGELDATTAFFAQPFGAGVAPAAFDAFACDPQGFFGLSGNVWDWCRSAAGTHRVIRGGGYMDAAAFCGVSARYRNAPVDRDACVGFRVQLECPGHD